MRAAACPLLKSRGEPHRAGRASDAHPSLPSAPWKAPGWHSRRAGRSVARSWISVLAYKQGEHHLAARGAPLACTCPCTGPSSRPIWGGCSRRLRR